MSGYRLIFGEPRRVHFATQPRNYIHRHTHYEPCLVVSGHGEFDHGDEHYRLRKGDLFIADPGVYHEIKSLRTRDLDLVFTAFAITEAPTATPEDRIIRDFVKGHAVWKRGQQLLTDNLLWLIRFWRTHEGAQRSFFASEAMRLLVLQIMAALATEPAGKTRASPALDRALRAIDARLHEPVWVEDIARAAGMSERSLRRLFQDELRRTVAAEIQERKIQRAATLLALPEFNVAEAGRQVGVEDPAQFSRLFKKVMGVTPREFQRAPPVGSGAMRTEFRDRRRQVSH